MVSSAPPSSVQLVPSNRPTRMSAVFDCSLRKATCAIPPTDARAGDSPSPGNDASTRSPTSTQAPDCSRRIRIRLSEDASDTALATCGTPPTSAMSTQAVIPSSATAGVGSPTPSQARPVQRATRTDDPLAIHATCGTPVIETSDGWIALSPIGPTESPTATHWLPSQRATRTTDTPMAPSSLTSAQVIHGCPPTSVIEGQLGVMPGASGS